MGDSLSNPSAETLVSVIMPCYNDGAYIQESIDSVLSQTYSAIELIIVNDGSTDKLTIDILASIEDTRITVLNSNRLRPSGARNMGIAHARGKYIMPVDSDDLIDETYIQKAVQIMEQEETIGAVYCKAELFGEQTGPWELPDYSFDKMLLDNIVFVTTLFRKSDWEKIGGFSTEMDSGMEDYDFWLSILEMNKTIHQIPEILFRYRIKQVSRTTEFKKDLNSVQEIYRKIYLRHPDFYDKYHREYAIILREALVDFIFRYETLQKRVEIYDKLRRMPFIRWFIKKFVT